MESDLAKTLAELSAKATQALNDALTACDTGKQKLIKETSFENTVAHEKLAHALVNACRDGKLIALPDDAVERMAKAICKSNVGDEDDWDLYKSDASAALAALTKGADHAG